LRGQLDAIDGAPAGSVGWIGDAPVFVLDDGDTVESTPPEQHASPRARILPPEVVAARLAERRREVADQSVRDVEAHIEQHFTQSQQRLLTAAYARAIGRGNGQASRKAKIDTILDWIESVTAHLFVLQAQVEAATTIEALDAIQFNLSLFPPPAITVKSVMTTPD
jgi:hypothetical protein